MNAKQLELAKASIEGDCDIIGVMLDVDTGFTCALGGLAVSAGYPLSEQDNKRYTNILFAVGEFYGLEEKELMAIMERNDRYIGKAQRQEAIIEYLNSLELE